MVRTWVAPFLTAFLVLTPGAVTAQTSLVGASDLTVAVVPAAPHAVAPPTPIQLRAEARPSVLPSMYVSLAALEGYDAYSTLTALKQGAAEANPMMRGVVGNPAALIAVKSAATFASIYASERLWRQHHRRAAIALMVVTNGTLAVLAAHNASVLRGQR
jgi:hypothetical protein